eukprot:g6394.t1
MTAKAAKRRKNRRAQLENEIQSFFQKSHDGSAAAIASKQDTELFSIDTVGNSESNVVDSTSTEAPLICRIPITKKSRTVAIQKKKKPKSKSARRKQKLNRIFDIWKESQKSNKVPKLGLGERPHLPAIPAEHPGCSYNPDPVQHEQALKKKKMEEARKTSRVNIKEEEESSVKEESIEEEVAEEEEVSEDQGIIYRPKIPERKTRAQRNKELRHKLLLKSIEENKKEKKLNAQINNLHVINKQITKELEQKQKNSQLRKAKTLKKMKQGIKKIGRKVIRSTRTRVLDTDQLVSALRQLHVSNDLALDRYVSLQKRGLVDTGRFRGRRNKPKYKYIHPGEKQRRLEEAKKTVPATQKRIQDLHNTLNKMKMSEKQL